MSNKRFGYGSLACASIGVLILASGPSPTVRASDHSDAPSSVAGVRQDANITDLPAFVYGANLVLAMTTNPAIPASAATYVFPTDVTFAFNIDVDSAVDAADPFGDGGTIVAPHDVNADVIYRVRFNADGSGQVQRVGRGGMRGGQIAAFFAGLRDDPFIRGPRQGRNSAAIVMEVPLSSLTAKQTMLLIWATTEVEEFEGTFQEIAGRSLRSMFPENAVLNVMQPKHHLQRAGLRPDVMIFDTSLPAAFPNGRALTDDVIDLVGDSRVLGNDAPFPSMNDKPFLTAFPYLASPH